MSELPSPSSKDAREPTLGSPLPLDEESLSTQQCRELFVGVEAGLRAFLKHRLRQESDVDDCLQVVFVKMLQSIRGVAPAAQRAWLYRVAANEAARMWRSESSTQRMLLHRGPDPTEPANPIDQAIHSETAHQIEQSLQRMPPSWREVVRLRIHQNLTFQQIADQLGIPLGTALTRMRRALERLRAELDGDSES